MSQNKMCHNFKWSSGDYLCRALFRMSYKYELGLLTCEQNSHVSVYVMSSSVSNQIWSNAGVSDILIRFTNPVAAFNDGLDVSFKNPPKSFRLPASEIFTTLKSTFAVWQPLK